MKRGPNFGGLILQTTQEKLDCWCYSRMCFIKNEYESNIFLLIMIFAKASRNFTVAMYKIFICITVIFGNLLGTVLKSVVAYASYSVPV